MKGGAGWGGQESQGLVLQGCRETTDGGGRTSSGSTLAWGSLDPPLHTQQQVVPEDRGQREASGGLSAAATQLSTHSQPGQVLQPPRLVHHAQGRDVEGFVLLSQEWNRIRWPSTLDPALPSGDDLALGAPGNLQYAPTWVSGAA